MILSIVFPFQDGYTALIGAVNKKNIEMVRLLLDKGADVETITDRVTFFSDVLMG